MYENTLKYIFQLNFLDNCRSFSIASKLATAPLLVGTKKYRIPIWILYVNEETSTWVLQLIFFQEEKLFL